MYLGIGLLGKNIKKGRNLVSIVPITHKNIVIICSYKLILKNSFFIIVFLNIVSKRIIETSVVIINLSALKIIRYVIDDIIPINAL
ncbi:hypothetical protein SAMN04487886_11213 [Clostridium sp. DSM 8431]|uniref:hypothetical protein n=1 Tax=Clostridium sp. DSM 8431 TaxID=1761781 RepID=UPI0008E4BAE5|nr:hypothetical protein [Clostridium sp. DSM 8431]SFU72777.1 hypothetical protein SAMN04487886_11213 [Clostridium sp. DSM 8431]